MNNAYEDGYEQGRKDVLEELKSFSKGNRFKELISDLWSGIDDGGYFEYLIDSIIRELE